MYEAKKAEIHGDWDEAARLYLQSGDDLNARACRLIVDAMAKGDQFRNLVQCRLQEAGLPPDLPACPVLDIILRKCYRKVYTC